MIELDLEAFGKPQIDHEGVGFRVADNLINLTQAELMIDRWAGGPVAAIGALREGKTT